MKYALPCRQRSRGAALISALLTVALATMLATQLISAQSEAIQNLSGRRDLAQARWLARGAAEWGRAILSHDARTSGIDHLGEPWAIKVPPIPIKSGQSQDIVEGELSGEIEELNGRFNLNRLLAEDDPERLQVAVFARLLVHLGSPERDAERLALALADWVDADVVTAGGASEASYYAVRLDNQALLGAGTLLKVPGFSAELLTRLQPFVTVLPKRAPLNLNTAPAEVLAAELPALGLALAQRAVTERERVPFRDLPDFNSRFPGVVVNPGCGVGSSFFLATTRASFGDSVVVMKTLLYRGSGTVWPDIIWQQML